MTSVGGNIANLLGMGTGIDTTSLVSQLVAASRTPRANVLSQRTSLNDTRISAIASAMGSLSTFSTALDSAIQSSGFAGQPVSNDPNIVAVSQLPGGVPSGLPAQIEVTQLAAAQTLESANLTDHTTAVGLGTLTLTTPSGAYTITIDSSNNTLDGLATAINAAGGGVTASVVTDNRGARLVIKGQTGAANAFTLTKEVGDTADIDLARFTFDGTSGGMTRPRVAADSIIWIDNVEMRNNKNEIETAIPFVRIDLNKAAPGTLVTIGTNQATIGMKDVVQQFVDAYNTLRTALNGATAPATGTDAAGALSGDAGIRDMLRQLQALTTAQLATTGTYRNLNDIGLSTNRDGTLKLDTVKLDAALAADPQGVGQMINPAVSSPTSLGLSAAVRAIKDSVEADSSPLKTSKARYDALRTELSKRLDKLNADMGRYETQLTTTYTAMEKQLYAFKATQTYLTNQIAQWNKGNN